MKDLERECHGMAWHGIIARRESEAALSAHSDCTMYLSLDPWSR